MRAKASSFLLLTALLAATSAHAAWRDQATTFDQGRLLRLSEARAKGWDAARSGSGVGDPSAITVLDAKAARSTAADYVGAWRCRTIKLGGMTPYIVYGWFNCRVSKRDGELFLEKISGSQRTQGFLYEDDGAVIYLGASSVGTEPPHTYSGKGASVGAPTTPDDQIGVLTMIGKGHARLELPFPAQESVFDVLELIR
jgi:hypothetical protein